nr:condensation domain-containing protein [Dactylosporangium thailandense]
MVQVIPVGFRGQRSVSGPLTVGQLNVAKWLADAPDAPAARLYQHLPVPPGTTLDAVVAALGALVSRHEGLRSRYVLGDPGAQEVRASGTVPLTVGPSAAPGGVSADEPVRFAATVSGGFVTELAAAYSHIAVDFQALMVLEREFGDLLRGVALPEVELQPLDRAEAERSPARRRRQEQALRHWFRHVEAAPAHLYARPRVAAAGGSGACGMSSAAAARALDRIAARTRVSRPTIVLAAWCALLSRRSAYDICRFVMLSANRFESGLRDFVGTLAQATFVAVDTAGAGFDELVRRAFGAVLQAGVHGAYHVYRQDEGTRTRMAARGVAPSFEPMFNSVIVDTRGFDVPDNASEPPPTDLLWVEMPPTNILLRFDLGRADELMVARVWTGDTGRVSPAEARELLLALERLLLAAAGRDLDAPEIAVALAMAPLDRPPGWQLVDGCWVDLAEVQRLVDDALGPRVARVDGPELTAVVSSMSPEEAHRRCLELLPGRHAAMVPRFTRA